MKTSEKGVDLIKKFEGFRQTVYLDQAKLPTVGYGHLLTESERKLYPVGTRLSKEQIDNFLLKDLEKVEKCINDSVKVGLTQNEFDALASFIFNIGCGQFKKSSVLRNLNNGDRQSAAKSILNYNKITLNGKKVVSKGLVNRRIEEYRLFLTKVEENPKIIREKEPVLEKVVEDSGDKEKVLDKVFNFLDTQYALETRMSRSSILTSILLKLLGSMSLIIGFIRDNWIEILVAFGILLVAVIFYHLSRNRAEKRLENISLNQS